MRSLSLALFTCMALTYSALVEARLPAHNELPPRDPALDSVESTPPTPALEAPLVTLAPTPAPLDVPVPPLAMSWESAAVLAHPAAPEATPRRPAASAPRLAPTPAAEEITEEGPRDIKSYIKSGERPNFLRIDVKGYNIRKTPDFLANHRSNIDFQTEGGDLFVVNDFKPMYYGAAVQIDVGSGHRWVYVPYNRKHDFEFCASTTCYGAMADAFDYLAHQDGVNPEAARECGVTAGPEGFILPTGAAAPTREPDPVSMRPKKPGKKTAKKPKQVATNPKPKKHTRVPATPRKDPIRDFHAMMSDSIDKYGQALLRVNSLRDAGTFCPRYENLSSSDRKEFWIQLFEGIGQAESGFHSGPPIFDESTLSNRSRGPINPNTFSMGLFQLSYGSSTAYRPACHFNWAKDRNKDISDPSLTIYDPKSQMDCATGIMNSWVPRDGGVGFSSGGGFRGGARFWSTLRSFNNGRTIHELKKFSPCW